MIAHLSHQQLSTLLLPRNGLLPASTSVHSLRIFENRLEFWKKIRLIAPAQDYLTMNKSYAIIGIVVAAAILGVAAYMVGTTSAAPVINLYMMDPPHYSGNVTAINITFTSIAIHSVVENESWITLTGNTTTINLLDIINSSEKLGSFSVPAGNYTQLRFMVSNATAVIDGQTYVLEIPSGSQTGLKVHFDSILALKAGQSVNMTIDIQVDDSDMHNGKLTPSMHAIIAP